MTTKRLNIEKFEVRKFYEQSIARFRKQYKDVAQLREIHINKEGKVFSGEWLDSKGVINFCGGYLPDCVKIIRFFDSTIKY